MSEDLREKVQNDALISWLNHGKQGTVEIATGLGKTFVALHALHTMPKKTNKVNIHLAETDIRKVDFLRSLNKYDRIFNTNTLRDYKIEFACYQSAYKWRNKEFGLVIADEIHDSLTPTYSNFYEYNIYDAIIGLSAKIDLDTSYMVKRGQINLPTTKEFFLEKYCKIIYSYTMTEARKDDLNRNLKIHLISHKLDNTVKNVEAGSKTKKFFQTEQQSYTYWQDKFSKPNLVLERDKRELFKKIALFRRNNLLYSLPSKIRACKKLLKHVDKTLIFGNNLDALEKVTPYLISSRNDKGKSKGKNEYFIKKFQEGKIDNLAAFKKLKQGANIEGLESMILLSYFSSEKDAIQRFGRLRNKENYADVFLFVTEKTPEQTWCNTMLSNIEDNYDIIRHDNIDQCIKYIEYKKNEK